MKKLFLFISIFLSINTYSQDCLNINGSTIDEKDSSMNSLILVTDANNTFVKLIECNGDFDINLPLETEYIITFMQQGYLSKSINISVTEKGEFKFKVRLIKTELQTDPIPVANIFYDEYSHQYNYILTKH